VIPEGVMASDSEHTIDQDRSNATKKRNIPNPAATMYRFGSSKPVINGTTTTLGKSVIQE
jgi:hypothetical protein